MRRNGLTGHVLAVAAAAVLLLLAWSSVSSAAEPVSRVGYFQTADGTLGFVFDRVGETPKQRFDHSPEILVLRAVPAPRGDTVYRLANGRMILRQTAFGGLTLFPPDQRQGIPVVRVSDAAPLEPAPRSLEQIERLLRIITGRLAWIHEATIAVSVDGSEVASDTERGVLGDAIENVTLAFDELLDDPAEGESLVKTVSEVEFRRAEAAGLTLEAGLLVVFFAPRDGVLGRPASMEVAAFVSRAFSDGDTLGYVPDDDGVAAGEPDENAAGASSNPSN